MYDAGLTDPVIWRSEHGCPHYIDFLIFFYYILQKRQKNPSPNLVAKIKFQPTDG